MAFFEIAERDHDIQNPTSAAKLRLLGEHLRLSPETHVLDLAAGRGGPALILAENFRCRITAVEVREAFIDTASERVRRAGLDSLFELVHADARTFRFEPGSYDVAMCLGASFIWDGLDGTLAALAPAVRPSGYVVVGEPYWRTWPPPADYPGADEPFAPLAATVARVEQAGLRPVGLIASSEDDWDRYESLHWRALEEWAAENPSESDALEIERRHVEVRDHYLRWQRDVLGWAIFVGWKAVPT